MCAEHHNHRTGNCAECRQLETSVPVDLNVSRSTTSRFTQPIDVAAHGGRLELMTDPYRKRPPMPLLWSDDGDDG